MHCCNLTCKYTFSFGKDSIYQHNHMNANAAHGSMHKNMTLPYIRFAVCKGGGMDVHFATCISAATLQYIHMLQKQTDSTLREPTCRCTLWRPGMCVFCTLKRDKNSHGRPETHAASPWTSVTPKEETQHLRIHESCCVFTVCLCCENTQQHLHNGRCCSQVRDRRYLCRVNSQW